MLSASASYHSFPKGRWLCTCPCWFVCLFFFPVIEALQTAGTVFLNLSKASMPRRPWLKGNTILLKVMCSVVPALQLVTKRLLMVRAAGWEAHCRPLPRGMGCAPLQSLNKKVPEPLQYYPGAHTG